MISKERLSNMIEIVERAKNMTKAEISLEMKYGKNYISELLSPSGKVTDKFVNSFKSKYGAILENPNDPSAVITGDINKILRGIIEDLEKEKATAIVLKTAVAKLEAERKGTSVDNEITEIDRAILNRLSLRITELQRKP